jgi:hypothetical protein
MKIILTESQVDRLINEQSEGSFDRRYSTATAAEKSNAANKQLVNALVNMDPHTRNDLLAFGLAFVPVVGPALSLGMSMYNAKTYYNEGKKKEAGLALFLGLLPGISTVVAKVPGVKQLGAKGMSLLADKIVLGGKLTGFENQIATKLVGDPSIVKIADVYLKNLVKETAQTQVYNAAYSKLARS